MQYAILCYHDEDVAWARARSRHSIALSLANSPAEAAHIRRHLDRLNMDFHAGWSQCTDQLAALVARL